MSGATPVPPVGPGQAAWLKSVELWGPGHAATWHDLSDDEHKQWAMIANAGIDGSSYVHGLEALAAPSEPKPAPELAERIAAWLYVEFSDYDDWNHAPERKREYYLGRARELAAVLDHSAQPAPAPAASAETQPPPELQAGEIVYLYHWRFDRGEEFGLYRHAADADAKAAQHADEGLSEVLSMAVLGLPEQPAPELAAEPAIIPEDGALALCPALSATVVIAAGGAIDDDRKAMMLAAFAQDGLRAVFVENAAAIAELPPDPAVRERAGELRAALAALADRAEAGGIITEDEAAEYRALLDDIEGKAASA